MSAGNSNIASLIAGILRNPCIDAQGIAVSPSPDSSSMNGTSLGLQMASPQHTHCVEPIESADAAARSRVCGSSSSRTGRPAPESSTAASVALANISAVHTATRDAEFVHQVAKVNKAQILSLTSNLCDRFSRGGRGLARYC